MSRAPRVLEYIICGDIEDEQYYRLWAALQRASGYDELNVTIQTDGGDFYVALAIYDLLKAQSLIVNTIATGKCFSAGSIILQAGDNRLASQNAQIMMHHGEESIDSPAKVAQNTKMFKLMKEIIGKRTKVSDRKIASWFIQDTYFNAEAALAVGLIDEVLTDNE